MNPEHRPVGSRYRAETPIGHGGMGEVWQGIDTAGGTPVAIKFLRPDLVGREDFVARFLRESRILKALDDPRLVGIRDFVAEGSSLAIVMDLVDGRDLGTMLAAQGPPGEDTTIRLLDEVLQGLAVVHAAGIAHGDVKPQNLLLPADGRPAVRIADFGIARIVEDAAVGETTSQVIGSPAYMAPELAQGRRPDRASDIYAVGVLAHELLTGQPPFHGGNAMSVLYRHLHEEPARPPGVSDGLWSWIARLLAKDPAARPTDALTALQMLRSTTADSSGTLLINDGDVPPSVSFDPDAGTLAGQPAGAGGTQVLPAATASTRELPAPAAPPPAAPAPSEPGDGRRRSRLPAVIIAVLTLVVLAQGVLLARTLLRPAEQALPPEVPTAGPSPSATPTRAPSPGVRRTAGPLPDVVGMHVSSAQDTLASYGYVVQIRESVDDNRPDGEVTGQEPGAGGRPSDGTVRLTVSRRSTVVWLTDLRPVAGAASHTRVDLPDRSFARSVVIGPACSEPVGVSYQLGRRYTRLSTELALSPAPPTGTSVTYRFTLDGREVQSGQLSATDDRRIQFDVDGGGLLQIQVATDGGSGCGPARLVLGDPRLVGLPG